MSKPLILIVGRPNVGKSTLFNRIINFNKSIVSSEPGTTRDQNFASFIWQGVEYEIGDSSGISLESKSSLNAKMDDMVFLSINKAKAIIFVVDRKTGLIAQDVEIFNLIRKLEKPVFIAVNKFDDDKNLPELAEFYKLGNADLSAISAAHNKGIYGLLNKVVKVLANSFDSDAKKLKTFNLKKIKFHPYPIFDKKAPNNGGLPKLVVLGRPNAGKSTLLNCWAGKNRVVVSNEAGTTRDAVDVVIKHKNHRILLIDTAGLRRKSQVTDKNEFMANKSALRSISLADVCLLLLDAAEGYTDQDAKILNLALEKKKSVLIAVNKWDLFDKNSLSADDYRKEFYLSHPYTSFLDIFFVSALKAKRTTQLLDKALDTVIQRNKKVALSDLNQMLAYINQSYNINSKDPNRLKIKYGVQALSSPPLFVFHLKNASSLNADFEKYVINQLRRFFGFRGTPLQIVWRFDDAKKSKNMVNLSHKALKKKRQRPKTIAKNKSLSRGLRK